MYDALYAGRYLSRKGEADPLAVLALIKNYVRSSRQRALLRGTLMEQLAEALVESGLLNEKGEQLATQEDAEE